MSKGLPKTKGRPQRSRYRFGTGVIQRSEKWRNLSGRWDSNPRPLGPEPSALAGLRYAPNEILCSSASLSRVPPPRLSHEAGFSFRIGVSALFFLSSR